MQNEFITIKNFLQELINSDLNFKISSSKQITLKQKDILKKRINQILKEEENGNCVLLMRGIKKKDVKKRLVSKLNSNDSLYDGLFLVGDKAKNYLHKPEKISHPIKAITEKGEDVVRWIFDEYSRIKKGPFEKEYFQNLDNTNNFVKNLTGNRELIDYYLYGLHTFNSDFLLNFVSSTNNPKTAWSHGSDLLIIFWLNKNHKHLVVSKESLDNKKNEIEKLKLPILNDSFYPEESEYSIKGFILPHYILGVYDTIEKEFILNPPIFKDNNDDWVRDGFEVDQTSFEDFIKTTKYKRFLTLYSGFKFEEKNAC